tara:strand:- start:11 stop:1000 length:990 start_codon:yes stop_codon:yes gene_type:complete
MGKLKKIKIGNIEIKNNIFLAPMSGVTDLPFRSIVKKFSPGLVYSEMIASRALIEKNRKTLKMLKKNNNELLAVQIAGCDPKVMAYAAKVCEEEGADIIDINMGCPVKKVTNGWAGSALMKDENLATKIIYSTKKSVKIPVTLKMRTGWNDSMRNAPKIAKVAEDIGISLITVHGRTRCQMYRGRSDWRFIKKVKNQIKIPLIANGDVLDCSDADKILKDSGADGFMIGRGTYGRPWIFSEIINFFKKKSLNSIKSFDIKEIILEHLDLNLSHYDTTVGVRNFRKHLSWYSKSFDNSNLFRSRVNTITKYRELKKIINEFFDDGKRKYY